MAAIELRCRALSGTACRVLAQRSWTIADVLNALEVSLGIPAAEVRLVNGAAVMHGSRLVGDVWGADESVAELSMVRQGTKEDRRPRKSRNPHYLPLAPEQKRRDPLRSARIRLRVNDGELLGRVDDISVEPVTDERWYTVKFTDGTRWMMHEGSVQRMRLPDRDEDECRITCKQLLDCEELASSRLSRDEQVEDGLFVGLVVGLVALVLCLIGALLLTSTWVSDEEQFYDE